MDKNLHLLIQHDLDPNIFSITLFQKVWWPQKIHMLQTNLPISWRKLEVVFQMTLGTLWKFIYKVLLYFFSMRKYPFLKAQYTLINIPWNCNNQIKGWHFCMFLYDWLLTCYFFKRVRGSRVCWKNETNKYVKWIIKYDETPV